MLKYQLNKQIFSNETFTLNYNNFSVVDNVIDNDDKIYVTLFCDDVSLINVGDNLLIVNYFIGDIDEGHQYTTTSGRYASVTVDSVDRSEKTICFLDDKYASLKLSDIMAEYDGNVVTWLFKFQTTHYFDENEEIILHLKYNNTTVTIGDVRYMNNNTLKWIYDNSIENIDIISDAVFGNIGELPLNHLYYGKRGVLDVTRDNMKWNQSLLMPNDNQSVFITKTNVKLYIPISLKSSNDLYQESNIKEYFVQHEEEKAVNSPIEMEKYVYTPVIVKTKTLTTETYEDCTKINFNLHFRAHSGDDWTVNDSDSWNFVKDGDNNNWTDNKYYSYAQSSSTLDNKWNRSCQSDLLKYLGFTTNDVKFQKNKLKKSFLRLSFYDSDDTGSQSLLAYSTVFMDCNKLYSKFVARSNFECYFDDNGDIVKGIKAEREVNTGSQYINGSLMNILDVSSMNKEVIEDYRLSSQITTKNKYLSDNSSEGFYLYTWELSDIPSIPTDIYMKVEFNHAGYGRNIPMMAPYRDTLNNKGFKTNEEIIGDWSNGGGYGIKKYTRYSYIHLKAKYDINTKRHIYYLDPDTYGVNQAVDGNVININLYEARINFS